MNFGYATLQIIPSMRGAKSTIEQELGGVDGTPTGKSIGSSITSGIGSVMKGAATTVVAGAATGIGIALTKGFARLDSLDKARAKLSGLGHDAASVEQIIGKGGDAMAAVSGTAFGLGEAATVAAGAVAAGVKPGAELQKTLTLVADAATIAGGDMGSMGDIFNKVAASNRLTLDIVNQLQTAGIPALQMVADEMGVTAEEASKMVTSGEVDFAIFQAAMEKGLGGAAQESGNTFSGAMKNIGAALGRVGEGFLGGVFPKMAPLFQKISKAIGPLAEKAAGFGEVVADKINPILDKLGDLLEGKLSIGLGSASKLLGPATGAFVALGASGLAPLVKMVPGLGGLAGKLGMLGGPVGIAAAAFAGLAATSPELREALKGLFESFGGIVEKLMPSMENAASTLGEVLPVALDALANVLTWVVDVVAGFVGWIGDTDGALETLGVALGISLGAWVAYKAVIGAISFVKLIAGLGATALAFGRKTKAMLVSKAETVALMGMYAKDMVVALGKTAGALVATTAKWIASTAATAAHKVALIATKVATTVATAAQRIFNTVMNANPILKIVTLVMTLVGALVYFFTETELGQAIWAEFTQFLGEAWENIVGFITGVAEGFAEWWSGLWDGIVGFFTAAWEGIPTFFEDLWQGVLDFLGGLWSTIVDLFMTWHPLGIIISNWEPISAFFTDLWNGIVQFFTDTWTNIGTFFSDAWSNLVLGAQVIGDGLAQWWSDLWTGIGDFIVGVWEGLTSFVSTTFETLGAGIRAIGDGIKSWWTGLWDGVKSAATSIWNGISSTAASIFTNVKNVIMTPVNFVKSAVVNAFNFVNNGIRNALSGISGFVGSAFQSVLGVIRGPINGIIGLVNGVIGALNNISVTIPDWVPVVGGNSFGVNLPKIPMMADGGTVLPKPGGTLAILAEAGKPETVVDTGLQNALIKRVLDMTDGGGAPRQVTVEQNITTVQDDPRLQARAWAREAQRGLATA